MSKYTLDIIKLHNAVFYAYHGAMSDEQSLGGKFEIDVELHCDLTAAKQTDNLDETVNYEKVYALMKSIVMGKKYYLIEALAHSIGTGIIAAFPKVQQTIVRVRKPGAPVHGVVDTIEVQIKTVR
ncbi:MAG: dihydroneopterin aldolase [Bacteriovoracaceae bacterium]|nr:dihydroneopterin aldolase [Bacteroidota bacterium]